MKRILITFLILMLPLISYASTYEITTPGNNVGIGSSNPGQALDVNGTVRANSFISTAGFSNFTANVGIGSATPQQALDVVGNVYTSGNIQLAGAGFSTFSSNVGIGSLSPGQALDVQGTIRVSQQLFISGIATDATKTDATVCEDTTTHQLYSGSGTLGICLGTSSARYKNNIVSISEGIRQIKALHPVNFFYNKGYGDNGAREQYGLIAEEVNVVLPKIVSKDTNNRPNSVDLLALVPILIKSIQEQQREIDSILRKVK